MGLLLSMRTPDDFIIFEYMIYRSDRRAMSTVALIVSRSPSATIVRPRHRDVFLMTEAYEMPHRTYLASFLRTKKVPAAARLVRPK